MTASQDLHATSSVVKESVVRGHHVYIYCMAGNFGGDLIWRIAEISVFGGVYSSPASINCYNIFLILGLVSIIKSVVYSIVSLRMKENDCKSRFACN